MASIFPIYGITYIIDSPIETLASDYTGLYTICDTCITKGSLIKFIDMYPPVVMVIVDGLQRHL
jgi:hypothetical protein